MGTSYNRTLSSYLHELLPQVAYVATRPDLSRAILGYVDSEIYEDLNRKMCAGQSLTAREADIRDVLLDAFASVPPLDHAITVFRGLRGAPRLDPARLGCQFVSTSADYEFALADFSGGACCMLEIRVSAGVCVIPMLGHGTSYELEVLLPPGGVWEVTGEEYVGRRLHYTLVYTAPDEAPGAPEPPSDQLHHASTLDTVLARFDPDELDLIYGGDIEAYIDWITQGGLRPETADVLRALNSFST